MKFTMILVTFMISDYANTLVHHDLPIHYEIVHPVIISDKSRARSDTSTSNDQTKHSQQIAINFHGYGKNFTLDLQKNQVLLTSGFASYQVDDNGIIRKKKLAEHCYYQGEIANQKDSTVVIDTCDGINGFIHDGVTRENFLIESLKKGIGNNDHIIYKPEHMRSPKKYCGNDHKHYRSDIAFNPDLLKKEHKRSRRSTEEMKYIEVVAISDKTHVKKYGGSEHSIKRLVAIMNHVDEVYKTLNTRVALIGVIAFNKNQFNVDYNQAGKTLYNLGEFIKSKIHGNPEYGYLNPDNTQLILGQRFPGSLAGLATTGDICRWTSSGLNVDFSSNAAITANTVAHEMGHNIGFGHTGNCHCPNEPCTMSSVVQFSPVKGFSDCYKEKYLEITSHGDAACVLDYPGQLYGNPKCGDGFQEDGEECDCGSEEECKARGEDKCCNPKTCKLQKSAECATGSCCEDCKFKKRGTLCRGKRDECDLEEYCKGDSNLCPKNFYAQDGTSCSNGTAFCYVGSCKSMDEQCRTLWGKNGVKSIDKCYRHINTQGNEFGNCGQSGSKYIECSYDDKLCGKLVCSAKSDIESIPKYPIIGSGRSIKIAMIGSTTCKSVSMSYPKDMDDPTLTLDGTKCGSKKMCIKHKCTDVATLPSINKCKTPCLNGGICNNNGNCHCKPGFACPDCRNRGHGGSKDSGQGCEDAGKNVKSIIDQSKSRPSPKKVGCFRESSKGVTLFNDRSKIPWGDKHINFTRRLVYSCNKVAVENGFKFFSIRYYGLCVGFDKIYEKTIPLKYCPYHYGVPCDLENEGFCYGDFHPSDMIYEAVADNADMEQSPINSNKLGTPAKDTNQSNE